MLPLHAFTEKASSYNFRLHTSQHKSFRGSWTLDEDTVRLNPYDYIFPDSTVVELLNNKKSSNTDTEGNLSIKKQYIQNIWLQDVLQQMGHQLEKDRNYFIRSKDKK